MALTLCGIPNCDTVKRARAWLDMHGIGYSFHDYKKLGAEGGALARWCDALGWEMVLNRAGTTFRKLAEHDKADLTRDRAIALMLAQPSMIRRPVLEGDDVILAGFKPDAWALALAGLRERV